MRRRQRSGVFLNGHTYTLRGGASYTQQGTFVAEASVGRAWRDYDHASLTDAASWVYDASLTFTPDETLTLIGSLDDDARAIDQRLWRHRCRLHADAARRPIRSIRG